MAKFYPNNPPHWLGSIYGGDPTIWCNAQFNDLNYQPREDVVDTYNGSTGCCLIPKYGEINYWLDENNVKIWG